MPSSFRKHLTSVACNFFRISAVNVQISQAYNSREITRERISLIFELEVPRSIYYASKVNHLKQTKPSQWWSAVKWITDMALAPGSDPLFANLQIEGSALLSEQEIVNEINSAFL